MHDTVKTTLPVLLPACLSVSLSFCQFNAVNYCYIYLAFGELVWRCKVCNSFQQLTRLFSLCLSLPFCLLLLLLLAAQTAIWCCTAAALLALWSNFDGTCAVNSNSNSNNVWRGPNLMARQEFLCARAQAVQHTAAQQASRTNTTSKSQASRSWRRRKN